MIAIVYLSESTIDFSQKDLRALSLLATAHNTTINVTGYLSYQRGRFVQYIEGEEEDVLKLMSEIEEDFRHDIMHKIQRNDLEKRVFPNWGMRLIEEEELHKFQLELCIETNILFIKNNFSHKEKCEKLLWSHVATISRIRNLLNKQA